MEPKENKWNPLRPDFAYPGWMNSEKHSGQALGTRRQSLALSKEASESQKHIQKHPNHENRPKWTQVARFGLRIRLFESQDHDESNETPSDLNYPNKIPQIDPMGRGRIGDFFMYNMDFSGHSYKHQTPGCRPSWKGPEGLKLET